MRIQYGTFSKRMNSTARPASLGRSADAELTEDCSVVNPVLKLGFGAWAASYNYVYIPSWGAYYFVSDARVTPGRVWYVSCVMDFAATYKESITGTDAHIIYANAQNSSIADGRLPIKTDATVQAVTTPLSDFVSESGTYVITAIGSCPTGHTPGGTRGAASYAIDGINLKDMLGSVDAFAQSITSATVEGSIIEIGRKLIGMGSVPENIRGLVWVPWNLAAMGDTTIEHVWFGMFDTDILAYRLDKLVKTFSTTISIPWQASDWRRGAPYHQIYLYIPFVGVIQLSPENLIGQTEIGVTVAINRMNGELAFYVQSGGEVIGTYSASCGIGIPAGVSSPGAAPGNAIGAITSAGMMIAGVATGAGAAATMSAAGLAGATAASGIKAITPNSISLGSLAGGATVGLNLNLVCYSVYHDVSTDPASIAASVGVPYSKSALIGSISGFVQCAGASVKGAMPSVARESINNMLNTGIFIE